MTVVRRVARPLLASVFVVSGMDALRHPAGRVQAAAPMVSRVAPAVGLPDDPELFVRANGVTMLAAGTMLGLGRLPRVSAAVLAGSLVPTTYVGHPFWVSSEPTERAAQRTQFLKNAALLGGLLLAAVDTEGQPGLPWRARRAAADARRAARTARREAAHAAKTARREARLAAVVAHDKLT